MISWNCRDSPQSDIAVPGYDSRQQEIVSIKSQAASARREYGWLVVNSQNKFTEQATDCSKTEEQYLVYLAHQVNFT